MNLYGYTGNNPVNRIDPRGLQEQNPTGGTSPSPTVAAPAEPDPSKHFWCGILGAVAGITVGAVVTIIIVGATGGAGTGVNPLNETKS